MSAASSPCIKLCVIDPVSKLCEGCGRTLAEIAQWASMSESEREVVMAKLPGRTSSPVSALSTNPPPADG